MEREEEQEVVESPGSGAEDEVERAEGDEIEEVVVLRDDEDVKVYQQHKVLADGREEITTTTISVNEQGEVMEETVTELVTSEDVVVDTDGEEDGQEETNDQQEEVDVGQEVHVEQEVDAKQEIAVTQRIIDVQEVNEQDVKVTQEVDAKQEADVKQEVVEQEGKVTQEVEAKREVDVKQEVDEWEVKVTQEVEAKQEVDEEKLQTEECEMSEVVDKQSEDTIGELLTSPRSDQDEQDALLDQPVKTVTRRISYEEFAEQYTEYKPPKRYEKKQMTTSADKAAPKIRIMSTDKESSDSQGLPSADAYPAATTSENLLSPVSSNQGDDTTEGMNVSPQPTRTQGSIVRSISREGPAAVRGGRTRSRSFDQLAYSVGGYDDYNRMDQDGPVDPANIVRADDKPDLEAELPSVGTSQSLKHKFQALAGAEAKTVDFSRPVRQESFKNRAPAPQPAPVVPPGESTHRIPEFEGGEVENTPQVRLDVVREVDRNNQEELPEMGQAKNLLSKWSKLEVEASSHEEYKPSGVGSKPTVTPLRPSTRVVEEDPADKPAEPEVYEFENTPVTRTDVVKESDAVNLEEELPSVGLAKSIRSQFRQKEEEAKKMKVYQPSGAGNRASRVKTRTSSTSSSEPHVEPQFEEGVAENTPITRPDVVRETDSNIEQELPEVGHAKSLKARLRELEEQQKPAHYVEHRPSGIGNKATPTPIKLRNSGSLSTSVSSLPSTSDEPDVRVEPQFETEAYENQPIVRDDVVREEDKMDENELPEAGLARNLRDRFKTLESEQQPSYKPSGVGSKPTPTPLRPHVSAEPDQIVNEETIMPAPEMGAWESTPVSRDDVIREADPLPEDDLPSEGITKNLQSQFYDIVSSQKPAYKPSGVSQKPTPTPLRPQPSVDLTEIINEETVMPAPEMGAWESTPVFRDDVIREADPLPEDDLPSEGITKNLQSQFYDIVSSQKPAYKPSGVSQKPTPTPLRPQPSVDLTEIINEETVMPAPEMGAWESTPVSRDDVIREADPLPEDDMPSEGITKNLQTQFYDIVSNQKPAYKPSGVSQKPTPTPLWPHPSVAPEEFINQDTVMPEPEMGAWENTPVTLTGVVRETDPLPTIYLPKEGVTRNRQSQYRSESAKQTKAHTPSGVGHKATPSKLHIMAGKTAYSAKGIVPEPVVNTNGVDHGPAVDAGDYENTPEVSDDVVRADTQVQSGDLPTVGVTKSIMSRFKSMEEEKRTKVDHTPSKVASKPTPTPLRPNSAVEAAASSDSVKSPSAERPETPVENDNEEINHNDAAISSATKADDVPAAGAAQSLLNKFRQLETQKSDQVEHRPSKVASSLTPTPLQLKR